jgi:hypothetical protein
MGETEKTSSVSKETFSGIDIEKVRVDDGRVNVTLQMPVTGEETRTVVRTFDFNDTESHVRFVSHPLF